MDDGITIVLPVEKPLEGEVEAPPETAPIKQAVEIVEVATALAEVISDAKDEGEDEQVFAVHAKLDTILMRLDSLSFQVGELAAREAAELIVEEEPETIAEVEAVKEIIEEQPAPVVEEVPVAVTPQIKKKKSVKWI